LARLLIVDDDETILDLMKSALINAGFETDSATTGREALQMLNSGSYDLLLTDILMPDICGLNIIDKAVEENSDITILAISGGGPGKDGADLLDTAITYGADAILQKPFRPDELIRTVKALVR
jgi:DNA-binding response OmpR family regulator